MIEAVEPVGLGQSDAWLNVYLANRPPLSPYQELNRSLALGPGEIAHIAEQTGNHWRKIFNVYAKLVHGLEAGGYSRWQDYRDQSLLMPGSGTGLWFSPPFSSAFGGSGLKDKKNTHRTVHIVTGRQYASSLNLPGLQPHDEDFSLNIRKGIIVAPYFDYRQLSNQKLEVLNRLILSLL